MQNDVYDRATVTHLSFDIVLYLVTVMFVVSFQPSNIIVVLHSCGRKCAWAAGATSPPCSLARRRWRPGTGALLRPWMRSRSTEACASPSSSRRVMSRLGFEVSIGLFSVQYSANMRFGVGVDSMYFRSRVELRERRTLLPSVAFSLNLPVWKDVAA